MEYGFYLYARILKRKLSEIVDTGFMTGRGAADAVFILRRLTKRYWSKGKKLFSYSIYIYIYIYIYTYSNTLKFYLETQKYWCAAGPVLPHKDKVPL